MIFAIKPFEIHDGDGIRTTVFFKGCPLRCKWCHNPESFSFQKELFYDREQCRNCLQCTNLCAAHRVEDCRHVFVREQCTLCGKCESICPAGALEMMGKELSAEEIANRVLKDEMFMKGSGGGVTFSGGEPLMQVELCIAIAKIVKSRSLSVAVDTSGYVKREVIDRIIPYTDTFLFDIKAIDNEVHMACTGVPNGLILDNIRYVDSLSIPIEIRYPYIPGMNEGEAKKIGNFVKELNSVKKVEVLAYHNYGERKYGCLGYSYPGADIPIPTWAELEKVREELGMNI